MRYYPVFLELRGKKVVVIGGGQVAFRKVETLLMCGANVHLVAKRLDQRLKQYIEGGRVKYEGSQFNPEILNGSSLVIAATDDTELNKKISKEAKKRNILINVVDNPEECNFIVPSIVKRGDLIVAISTSGSSPALSKRLRERFEDILGKEYELFLNLMKYIRKGIISKGLSSEENRRIFYNLVDSPLISLIKENRWEEVSSKVEEITGIKIPLNKLIDIMDA